MSSKHTTSSPEEGQSTEKPKTSSPKAIPPRDATDTGNADSKSTPDESSQRADTPTENVVWIPPNFSDESSGVTRRMLVGRFTPLFGSHKQAFGPCPYRTPLYKKKGKDLKADSGSNRSSVSLARLFNRIKSDTLSKDDTATYHRGAFNAAFADSDEYAVAASGSRGNSIIRLDRDYIAEVNLRHNSEGEEDTINRVSFVRRAPYSSPGSTDMGSENYEYFIRVPRGTTITVNGLTFRDDSTEVVIGPLQRMAVIELLSQPLFFFRSREDLNAQASTRAKARQAELRKRDSNGDTPEERTDITWNVIEDLKKDPKKNEPDTSGSEESDFTEGSNEKPCEALRKQLKQLKDQLENDAENDEEVRKELDSIKRGITEPGYWLDDAEVALAIATITLAITRSQDDENLGFSTVDYLSCLHGSLDSVHVPRPCRPMFLPVVHKNHIVLGLVQLDQDEKMTVSVLDSKQSHYRRGSRQEIFARIMATADRTYWWRHQFNSWEDVPRPEAAQWIPCAQQPDDSGCGYHTILNSWALALGLELNPYAAPIWATGNGGPFQTIQDIVLLARLGRADWKLLYNFLRCYRFVLEGEVPKNRRFDHSVLLQDNNALRHTLEDMVVEELENSSSESDKIKGIHDQHIDLPHGLDHNSTFPEDGWNWASFINSEMARTISKWGHLRSETFKTELKYLYFYFIAPSLRSKGSGKFIGGYQAQYFHRSLERSRGRIDEFSREEATKRYRSLLQNERSKAADLSRLEEAPCSPAGEGIGRLQALLDDPDLSKKFANPISGRRKEDRLELPEINMAIAAVVEAIDQHQANLHRDRHDSAFTGGFALSTSQNLQAARFEKSGAVSRPRRCFLMPVAVSGAEIDEAGGMSPDKISWTRLLEGHFFLAVVQEEQRRPASEDSEKSHFCVFTLDSAPERFQADHTQTLFNDVVHKTARNLSWNVQRSGANPIRFRDRHADIPVLRQQEGDWQCGLHVILNAWILALGLKPSTNPVDFNNGFYEELWLLVQAALAGLLDWQTLVAWLFCVNATTSQRLELVLEDRRFETTQFQDSEDSLAARIEFLHEQDERSIRQTSETQLPYDHSNNIDFERTDPKDSKISENKVGEAKKDEGGGAKPPTKGLNRILEECVDFGPESLIKRASGSLKRRCEDDVMFIPHKKVKCNDVTQAILADMDADGDVSMTGSPWRKSKVGLAFLGAL